MMQNLFGDQSEEEEEEEIDSEHESNPQPPEPDYLSVSPRSIPLPLLLPSPAAQFALVRGNRDETRGRIRSRASGDPSRRRSECFAACCCPRGFSEVLGF